MKTFTKESLEKLQKGIYLPDLTDDILHYQKSHLFFTHKCPFHDHSDNKTDQYSLIVTGNKYYCFECEASGDATEFLMTHKKMTFVEAIETLAEKFGVELEQVDDLVFRNPVSQQKKQAKQDKFDQIEKLLKELIE